MTAQVFTSVPMWLSGCTYDGDGGNDLRNSSVTATFYDTGASGSGGTIGVRGGVTGGAGLGVTAGTGLNVAVGPGSFVVPNTATPTAGGYVSTLAAAATLQVAAGNPTNPRVDIVVAYVSDTGTSASFGAVEILTGTPAPSPAAPAAPANSITLARIAVAANASSVTGPMITDTRPYTTAAGGILVAQQGTVQGYNGQLAYDPVAGVFYHNAAAGGQPFSGAPFGSTYTTMEGATFSGVASDIISTFTADMPGGVDLQVYVKWPGLTCSLGGSWNAVICVLLDGTLLDSFYTPNDPADGHVHSGGSWTCRTSSGAGNTPAAGGHIVQVTAQNLASGGQAQVYGAPGALTVLETGPVAG